MPPFLFPSLGASLSSIDGMSAPVVMWCATSTARSISAVGMESFSSGHFEIDVTVVGFVQLFHEHIGDFRHFFHYGCGIA
jgi:hypothetical protein